MTTPKLHATVLTAVLASLPVAALAEEKDVPAHDPAPFQLSLWESVQIVDEARPIEGVRLSLPYGRNRVVRGLDVGVVSRTDAEFLGAQFSIVGIVGGDLKGFQHNWLWGSVGGQAQGVQMSVVNVAGSLEGAQLGGVNYAKEGATGVGLAFVNVFEGPSVGAEIGIVNYATRIEGFQLGLVNVTGHLHGVQIGLVNVASNGFLPVFPIVNAAL